MSQTGEGSFRAIARATSLLGSASVINIVASVLRTKMAALVLGPAGIGLIGLFQTLVGMAAAVAGLGIGTVGARQIAQASAEDDRDTLFQASQALLWGTVVLAAAGGSLFYALRAPLASWAMGDIRQAGTIGWLSLGLAATVLTSGQAALLTGLRRLRALAQVGVAGAVLSIGVAAIALFLAPPGWVVVAYVVGPPLVALIVGQYVILRHWPMRPSRPLWSVLRHHWAGMARIGFWFTAAGLIGAAAMLAVRVVLNRSLGAADLGRFQAAWAISSMYLSVILQAMGSDYYPRLSAIIGDREEVNRTVNAQTEALLLMAAPIILAVLAAAPLIVRLLYSQDFAGAAWILRWQVLGDVLKLAAWPMSFVLLAAGDGRRFFLTDATAPVVMIAFLMLATPRLGIAASGLAFLVMYAVYLIIVFATVRHRNHFSWSRNVVVILLGTAACATLVLTLAAWSEPAALVVGTISATGAAAVLVMRLASGDGIAGAMRWIRMRLG